jgi:hypothetical protein
MRERGYALWLTVLVLALLALAALALAQTFDLTRARAETARADAQASVAAETAMARVAFLMLTEPVGPRSVVVGGPRDPGMASAAGAPELRLDGRLYNLGDGVRVGVQDEAGLIDVNGNDERVVANMLEGLGVRRERARVLAAGLADFVDADDLVRTGGAERVRLPEGVIGNVVLTTRWGVLDAVGWRNALEDRNIADRVFAATAAGDGEHGVNINTAPLAVLTAMLGPRLARDVFARREQSEIRDATELTALAAAGADAAGAGFATMPGNAFRVTLLLDNAGRGTLFVERRLLLMSEGARPVLWIEERRGAGDAGYGNAHGQAIEPFPFARSAR